MARGIDYVDLIEEQYNLKPIPYFVFGNGFRLNEIGATTFLLHADKLRREFKEKEMPYTLKNEPPLITIVLYIDQNKKCVIKSMSIRSRRDEFDMDEGINQASYYALRHLKGRGIVHVKNESSIRTLIKCCMGITVHSETHPQLDLFERSLLQSKKSLVKDIQNGTDSKISEDYFNKMKQGVVSRQESIFSKLLHKGTIPTGGFSFK